MIFLCYQSIINRSLCIPRLLQSELFQGAPPPPHQHPASAFPKATEVEGPVLSPAHMSVDPKEPMQLDRVLLSPSERPRRLKSLHVLW